MQNHDLHHLLSRVPFGSGVVCALGRLALIVRAGVAVPLAFLSLALMALAVLLAEGRDEVRRWWAAQ